MVPRGDTLTYDLPYVILHSTDNHRTVTMPGDAMPSPSRLVHRLLTDAATRHPERTAIVLGEEQLSYAELDAASNQVANLLVARGILRGDKVALSCPNVPAFTVIYYGILKAGGTVVPLNVLLKPREVS